MKNLITLLVSALMLFSTSCLVVVPNGNKTAAPSNGKKKGWYKNRHNPHNPNSDNPGHQKKHFTCLDFQ